MKGYSLRLDENVMDKIKELAAKDERSINWYVNKVLLKHTGLSINDLAAETAPQISPISPPSSEPKPVKVDSKPTSNGAQMSTEQKPSSTSAAVPAWKQRVLDKQAAKQYSKLEQKPPVIEQQAPIELTINEDIIDLESF